MAEEEVRVVLMVMVYRPLMLPPIRQRQEELATMEVVAQEELPVVVPVEMVAME